MFHALIEFNQGYRICVTVNLKLSPGVWWAHLAACSKILCLPISLRLCWQLSQFAFCCCDKTVTKTNLGVRCVCVCRIWLITLHRLESFTKVGTQAGLWRQELKQKVEEPSQLSYLPYTAPGMAPATVGSTLHIKHLLHQSVIRKKPDMAVG